MPQKIVIEIDDDMKIRTEGFQTQFEILGAISFAEAIIRNNLLEQFEDKVRDMTITERVH